MIKPILNKILFKPFLANEKTSGGIYIPFEKEMDKGLIVAVGGGNKHKPMRLKAGQVAYRVHEWGDPIEENNETFYLMDDSAILALN